MDMATAHAMRVYEQGPPEAMRWETVDIGTPGQGEVQVRHRAIGLNYIDTYHRGGIYKVPVPTGIGSEAAGVVEAIGPGVTEFAVGDRVAYGGGTPLQPVGSYSDLRNVPVSRIVRLPEAIGFDTAAAMMLKGLTVRYLIKRTFPVKAGDTVVFHAAAGGVGLIACQWLRSLGVTTIGTAGSDDKCQLALKHGAHHCINYKTENFVEAVKRLTGGKGVPVVYDGVGKDTFEGSLDCLAPFGTLVTFGNASGSVPPVDLGKLRGSLFVTRPALVPHITPREALVEGATDLFDVVTSGKVTIEVNQRYALSDAVQAHRDLESRKTTGSTILVP